MARDRKHGRAVAARLRSRPMPTDEPSAARRIRIVHREARAAGDPARANHGRRGLAGGMIAYGPEGGRGSERAEDDAGGPFPGAVPSRSGGTGARTEAAPRNRPDSQMVILESSPEFPGILRLN